MDEINQTPVEESPNESGSDGDLNPSEAASEDMKSTTADPTAPDPGPTSSNPAPVAVAPAPPQVGQMPPITKFCPSCGNGLVAAAAICPNCGSPAGGGTRTVGALEPKVKSTAILLAVFLGLFTWLYTYKRDATKFWVALGVSFVTMGMAGPVFWIWAIIDSAMKTDEYYANFPNG